MHPMRITEPGLFPAMSAQIYHGDPAPEPSLSASIACTLLMQTPIHAWAKHPRLNSEWAEQLGLNEPDSDRKRELGSVAHELLLGRGRGIAIIDADDYRTKDAREQRDEALRQGKTPCLAAEFERAEEIVDCIRHGLERIPGADHAFKDGNGSSEVAGIWHEPHHDVWGRILIDWLEPNGTLWDLKSTGAGLSDEAIRRKIAAECLDLRCAWYVRGLTRLKPELAGRVAVNLVFVETKPPFEVRIVRLTNASLNMGHRKVAFCLDLWARCLKSGRWPGYPREITRLDVPAFAEKIWLEREEYDAELRAAVERDPFVSVVAARDERPSPMIMEPC